ncbi:MAG TPA: hypothetical protein VHF22_06850 [Planctomycetota bacterium]|nr:hypothetical protein [Planctomycetota bacterium]
MSANRVIAVVVVVLASAAGAAAPRAPAEDVRAATPTTGPAPTWTIARLQAALGPRSPLAVYAVGPYVLATDIEQEQACRFVEELLPVRESICRAFLGHDAARPVALYYLATPRSYADTIRRRGLPAPPSATSVYCPETLEIFIRDDRRVYGAACRETARALLDEDFAGKPVPAWFVEGFAAVFEWPVLAGEGRYAGGPGPRFEALRRQGAIPLERLLASGDPAALEPTARFFCLYLDERRLLAPLYRALRRASAPDPGGRAALEATTGAPLAELDARFRTWLAALEAVPGPR